MSTPAITAPFLAATAVLGLAGLAKLWQPDDTARALRAAGLPVDRRLVRVGSLAEVTVAVVAVAAPGAATGSLVAVAYLAFSVFVAAALIKGWPLSSCGCFGRPDTRPGSAHLALDAGAAATAVWWAMVAPSRIGPLFVHGPWHGAPLILVTAVIAGLAYLVWTNPAARTQV